MTLTEFQSKLFPEKSVFDRRQFDFHTNLVKWFAIRMAYILWKVGISANLLDVLTLLASLCGFALLVGIRSGNWKQALFGAFLIYFHLFSDFADGAIAKVSGKSSPIGDKLDALGCEANRLAMLTLLGILSANPYILIANTFAGGVLALLIPSTFRLMPTKGLPVLVTRLYRHKYSFLSVRLMLVGLPFLLVLTTACGFNIEKLALILSLGYQGAAFVWLAMTIPHYVADRS